MNNGHVTRIRVVEEHLFNHVLAVYLNVSKIWSLLHSLPLYGELGLDENFPFLEGGPWVIGHVPLYFLRSLAKGIVLSQSFIFLKSRYIWFHIT